MESAATRRSARTARVAAAPAPAAKQSLHAPSWRTACSLLCHAALLVVFAGVWHWHFTPAASMLPGAKGFGRFARFLTFYSFTWQVLVWTLALLADVAVMSRRAGGFARALAAASDDAACAALPLATVVTCLYYGLLFTNPRLVEEDVPRPLWLSPTMHLANSGAAWADALLGAPRSFSPRSARWSAAASVVYALWIQVVKRVHGSYPYPVLNVLPHPHGSMGFTAVGFALFGVTFVGGRALKRALCGGAARGAAAPRRRKAA